VTGLVTGKQMKGESLIEVEGTLEAEAATATEAVNKQNIPREYKKQAREYFEKVGNTKD
jgi:hypothetical protein